VANNHGILFINKVLQSENFGAFSKYGINEASFTSAADRKHFKFIETYYKKNGNVPSYAMMTDTFDDFVYVPDITDRFEPLAEGILNRKMAVEFNELFARDFESIKESAKGDTSVIIDGLTEKLADIKLKYTNVSSPLTSLKTSADEYLSEYKRRQVGDSFDTWNSFMPYMTEEIGGYTSGNLYVWWAR